MTLSPATAVQNPFAPEKIYKVTSHISVRSSHKPHRSIMATTPELANVQELWNEMKPKSTIYRLLLGDIEIVSASKGVVNARLRVEPIHLNSKGTLHGTVSACLTDWAGGMAIASTGLKKTGLSTDIHTTYISTAKEGDWLEVEGRASKVGSTLAFTTVEIRKAGEGDSPGPMVCTGTHTKYVKQ
ncbi:MAG: hypothetical protein Q9187_005038 [Circinaria calcarea]